MIKLIYIQYLKTKNQSLRKIVVLLPIIYSCLLIFYITTKPMFYRTNPNNYGKLLLGFTIAAIFVLSVLIPLIYSIEKEAGNFANEFLISVSRKKLFCSRFLLIMSFVFFSELISTFIFLFFEVTFTKFHLSFFLVIYLFITVLICISPIVPIYQFLACKYNYSGSLLVGIVFLLSSILIGTTALGKWLWHFIPWSWGIYSCSNFISSPNNFTRHLQTFNILNIQSILLVIILIVICANWYEKWEVK